MKAVYPFPEALTDGENWRVRSGDGAADLVARTLYVPMDTSTESRFIRTHEVVHAEKTKGKIGEKAVKLKVGIDCLNAMEDARINRFIRDNISDVEAIEGGGLAPQAATDLGEHIAKSNCLRASVLALVATSSSLHLRSTLEATFRAGNMPLYCKAMEIAELAERWLFLPASPSQSWCELMSQRLEALLRGEGASAEAQGETAQALLKVLLDEKVPGEPVTEQLDELMASAGLGGRLLRARDQLRNHWGDFEIKRPPLTEQLEGRLARRWRPSQEGAGVRYLHRFGIDRAIFASRRRVRGGSVLIDASGSMSLSTDDIGALVRAAPGATVAAYCGKGDRGSLWILAAGGKMADLKAWASERCTGNIVDGPALKWLALQARPRIWVSDGGVSGSGDNSAPNLILEARSIVAAGSIRQAREMKAALKLLRPGGLQS